MRRQQRGQVGCIEYERMNLKWWCLCLGLTTVEERRGCWREGASLNEVVETTFCLISNLYFSWDEVSDNYRSLWIEIYFETQFSKLASEI